MKNTPLPAWLLAAFFMGRAVACEPPAGFVAPPRPDIAPLDGLLTHTEVREIAQPLAEVMRAANRPLRIDATKDLAGVSGTFRLSEGPYGTVGARRLVCKTDGTIAVEEVLETESSESGSRFRYVVWNQTGPKFQNVAYAVGEFVRTQPAPDKTRVSWTYRFALKEGASAAEKSRFQRDFLDGQFAEWMRTQMDRKPPESETPSPTVADAEAVAQAMRQMYVALTNHDTALLRTVTTTDFYAFDVGEEFSGDGLMALIKRLNAEGKKIVWNVMEPKVRIEANVAWITYTNRGYVQDAAGKRDVSWLESAVLLKLAGAWRIQFFHSTRVPVK